MCYSLSIGLTYQNAKKNLLLPAHQQYPNHSYPISTMYKQSPHQSICHGQVTITTTNLGFDHRLDNHERGQIIAELFG